jgi:hypothetical protein
VLPGGWRKKTEICYLDPRLKCCNGGKLYDGVGALWTKRSSLFSAKDNGSKNVPRRLCRNQASSYLEQRKVFESEEDVFDL